jgi:hypothetical protein
LSETEAELTADSRLPSGNPGKEARKLRRKKRVALIRKAAEKEGIEVSEYKLKYFNNSNSQSQDKIDPAPKGPAIKYFNDKYFTFPTTRSWPTEIPIGMDIGPSIDPLTPDPAADPGIIPGANGIINNNIINNDPVIMDEVVVHDVGDRMAVPTDGNISLTVEEEEILAEADSLLSDDSPLQSLLTQHTPNKPALTDIDHGNLSEAHLDASAGAAIHPPSPTMISSALSGPPDPSDTEKNGRCGSFLGDTKNNFFCLNKEGVEGNATDKDKDNENAKNNTKQGETDWDQSEPSVSDGTCDLSVPDTPKSHLPVPGTPEHDQGSNDNEIPWGARPSATEQPPETDEMLDLSQPLTQMKDRDDVARGEQAAAAAGDGAMQVDTRKRAGPTSPGSLRDSMPDSSHRKKKNEKQAHIASTGHQHTATRFDASCPPQVQRSLSPMLGSREV